jgi:hypothetical protein
MKTGIVVTVLAATLLFSIVTVTIASPDSIQWDLDSEFIATGVSQMERVGGLSDTIGQSGTVTIGSGSYAIWRADEAAQCNVGFPAEEWTGRITRTTNVGDQCYKAYIGIWDGTSFTSKGDSGVVTILSGEYHKTFSIEAEAFTVPEDDYLALNVTHEDGSLVIKTDGSSWVMWPLDDPAYPVPELPTIVLTSVGLLALAGYVGWRRKNKR